MAQQPPVSAKAAKQALKMKLYGAAPMAPEVKAPRRPPVRDAKTVSYLKAAAEDAEYCKKLNDADLNGDYMERIFWGNNSDYIKSEMQLVIEETAEIAAQTKTSPQIVNECLLDMQEALRAIPVDRTPAQCYLLLQMVNLPRLHARIKAQTDELGFLVMTAFLATEVPIMKSRQTTPVVHPLTGMTTNVVIYDSPLALISRASIYYFNRYDRDGAGRRYLARQKAEAATTAAAMKT